MNARTRNEYALLAARPPTVSVVRFAATLAMNVPSLNSTRNPVSLVELSLQLRMISLSELKPMATLAFKLLGALGTVGEHAASPPMQSLSIPSPQTSVAPG